MDISLQACAVYYRIIKRLVSNMCFKLSGHGYSIWSKVYYNIM